MYKYTFQGNVDTARDFIEARVRTGMRFPQTFRSFSYYLVRLWQWDTSDTDFNIEILNEPGHQIFNKYDEALNCFNNLTEELPDHMPETVKLELVQYHMGVIYPLESRVLMPLVSLDEC